MESVNLTETHQTRDGSNSNGNDSKLLECSFCDTRNNIQQNWWRAFYPPVPRCMTCLQNDKNCTKNQLCLFPSQFLHPAFDSGFFCQSYCCNRDHNIAEPNLKPSCKSQLKDKCEKASRLSTPHTLCQKMKQKAVGDKIGEKKGGTENESHSLPQYQNEKKESQCNCQSCDYGGESPPWNSSTVVIPIVSYCVLWNPLKPNDICTNYSCSRVEKVNREKGETDREVFSNTEGSEKCSENLSVENECSEGFLVNDNPKKKADREHNRSCSSFLSLHSSNQEEDKMYSIRKRSCSPSSNMGSDINSEEEAKEELQNPRSVSSNNSLNNLSVKSHENIPSDIVDHSNIVSAGNESQRTSPAVSELDLKIEDSSDETDDQIKYLNEFSGEKNNKNSPKMSMETLEEKSLEECNSPGSEPCSIEEKITKKMVKHFTVGSPAGTTYQGKPQSFASGGDLGGNDCPGFKVTIESEETQAENTRESVTKQNSELKRILLNDFEKGNLISRHFKYLDSKYVCTPKTGIAKLIKGAKAEDSKIDIARNIKRENKELHFNGTKRMRFPNGSQIKEQRSKFQNDKSPMMTQTSKNEPENQNPTSNSRTRSSKQEEKTSVIKIRPHKCDQTFRK